MCAICCSDSCDSCSGIPQAKGDAGQPAFLNLNFVVGGLPFSDFSNNWIEAGRFIFSKDIASIFTSLRLNIWRSGGVSVNWRIKDLVSGTVITSGSVTSTSALNIETKKALQIYNSSSAIIAVEVQSVSANTVFVGSAIFSYEA